MGKMFKITGNFFEDDENLGPDFAGEIVVFKNNRFVGRVDQSHEFICGTFGHSVLLLSNKKDCRPALYLIYKTEAAQWTGTQYTILGEQNEDRTLCRGVAKIKLEEIPFSVERAKELRAHYKKADLEADWNRSYTTKYFAERVSKEAC